MRGCQAWTRAGLRHWGPHAKVLWGPSLFLPSPSLSGPFLRPPLSPLPLHPVPSSAISLPSFYLFSFRSGHLNTAMGPGERCKLPQWGGAKPSRQTIWCIFESKRAALVAGIFFIDFHARIYVIFIIFCTKIINLQKLCPQLSKWLHMGFMLIMLSFILFWTFWKSVSYIKSDNFIMSK